MKYRELPFKKEITVKQVAEKSKLFQFECTDNLNQTFLDTEVKNVMLSDGKFYLPILRIQEMHYQHKTLHTFICE